MVESCMMDYMLCWLVRNVTAFLDNRIKSDAAMGRYVDWATMKGFLIERSRDELREIQVDQKIITRV